MTLRTILLLALVPATAAAPAYGAAIDVRTLRISAPAGGSPSVGASSQPVLSSTGRAAAFVTTSIGVVPGDELNGEVADVVVLDGASGERRLVSAGLDGAGADGASVDPAVSRDGQRVVFTSEATNLVAGDDNGVADVFVRDGIGRVQMVSVAADGGPGNRPSRQADVSADGRFVVFASDASDLVAGDSNGRTDIFVRDLVTGATTRASVSTDGDQGTLPSSTPAISANGRVVSFESSAPRLVPGDTNGVADIFVRDLVRSETTRVSVNAAGRQQNRAVTAPFRMVSDLDDTGRRVVFDSEATNLVRNDTNRRSDVFIRDRQDQTTRLVSANVASVQGNNDSVSPSVTPSGRHVVFQSFATNLVGDGDGTGADIFVRDLEQFTTSIASVAADGSRRQPELSGQVLQQPAIADNGELVAFVSTAQELASGDVDRFADVFVRVLTPPTTSTLRRSTRSVTVEGDDAVVTRFVCRIDIGVPFSCGPTVSLRQPGKRITIRATGPGLLADPVGRTFGLTLDRIRPRTRITSMPATRRSRTIRGRASDRGGSGISRVEIAATYVNRVGRCFFLDGRRWKPTFDCQLRTFRNTATGRDRWRFKIPPPLPRSILAVSARTVDGSGNVSPVASDIKLFP